MTKLTKMYEISHRSFGSEMYKKIKIETKIPLRPRASNLFLPSPPQPFSAPCPHPCKRRVAFETQTQKNLLLGQMVRPQAFLDCQPGPGVPAVRRGPGQGWPCQTERSLLSFSLAPRQASTQPRFKQPSSLTEHLLSARSGNVRIQMV